jgi:DNA polymerase III epsilon subunit family exonuclease
VETTGLNPSTGDAICEIGAVKIRNNKIVGQFQTLVNPNRLMPREAFLVHKISDQELKTAPFFSQIVDKFNAFIDDSVLFAYNAGFDINFINTELAKIRYPNLALPIVDVLIMARRILTLPKYNLQHSGIFFGLTASGDLHRAAADADLTAKVFLKLSEIVKDKGIESLADYISLYGINDKIFRQLENKKAAVIQQACVQNVKIKAKIISRHNLIREEIIGSFNLIEDKGRRCLAYRNKENEDLRILLGNVLDVETV